MQQSRARKDPLGLPAVFKNPTGFRVEEPWGQEAADRLPADPTLPGLGKNPHSFAAARARRDREVYWRRCPHDADPPGAFIFGHTYAAGPWGLSEGGRLSDADRPPGLLGLPPGGKNLRYFCGMHARCPVRGLGRASQSFYFDHPPEQRTVWFSSATRAEPAPSPPMRNLRRLAHLTALGFAEPLSGV